MSYCLSELSQDATNQHTRTMENIDGEATWKSQSGPVASKSVRHPVHLYKIKSTPTAK